MEDSVRRWNQTSTVELKAVRCFAGQLREAEEASVSQNLLCRDTNTLNFYKITPKDELPKYLQKMQFQTLHLKESSSVLRQRTLLAALRCSGRRIGGRLSRRSERS